MRKIRFSSLNDPLCFSHHPSVERPVQDRINGGGNCLAALRDLAHGLTMGSPELAPSLVDD